jgi:putative lipoprotein (rSAM/lipoprotein system)
MKNLFLKHFDKIILALLGCIGFLTGCSIINPPVAEYGVPSADYIIIGTLTDTTTLEPIRNIKIIRCDSNTNSFIPFDTIYTDSQGKYQSSIRAFPILDPIFKLKVDDIDGIQNGGDFQSKTVEVVFTSGDWIEIKSGMYKGKAQKTVDIKLKKK